jgi:hypothetical protein
MVKKLDMIHEYFMTECCVFLPFFAVFVRVES